MLRFLIVQLDMSKHPRDIASEHHIGMGVLFPVSADGFYDSQERAAEVAAFMAECHPELKTLVLEVKAQVPA